MQEAMGFIASQKTDHAHVERTVLLAEIDEELARAGIVELCAPWGYGRTDLLVSYARIAHAKAPLRPIVAIDFDSYEAQAFLDGNSTPLESRLAREARSALWLSNADVPSLDAPNQTGVAGGDGARRSKCRGRVSISRALSSQSGVALYVKTCVHALAPVWSARFERGGAERRLSFKDRPLITIDNLPELDEEGAAQLAALLRLWAAAGARVLIACLPSHALPMHLIPGMVLMGARRLAVSEDEIVQWRECLKLSGACDILGITNGVPLLVDACRTALDGNPLESGAYMRASERVMERCLADPMCEGARNARYAMALLGRGRLDDLATLGIALREDELDILAESFPPFGIDCSRGGFSCIPISVDHGSKTLAQITDGGELLAERCVKLMVARGRVARASAVAARLSDAARLRLYGSFPDTFADGAEGEAIARSLHSVSLSGDMHVGLRAGLVQLARLYAMAHDLPERTFLSDESDCPVAGGALRAFKVVLGYWRGFVGLRINGDATPVFAGDGGADDIARGTPASSELLDQLLKPPLSGEGLYDLDSVVLSMGTAAMNGDVNAYREQLRRLCALVDFERGGLEAAICAAHVGVCGFLCGEPETVLTWIEPQAECAQVGREHPGRLSSVSDAILSSLAAVARFLVERPSTRRIAEETFGQLNEGQRYFEERDIAPGSVFMAMLQGACFILGGEEVRADAALRTCQARWTSQGVLAGQLVASLGLAVTCFARDSAHQARVHARTAETLAQRLGVQRAVWYARLLETIALVRVGSAPDLDRRLLEATLRQSSLYPRVSLALNIELVVLYAVTGDSEAARDAMQGIALAAKPLGLRILMAVARCLGRERPPVLEVMPEGMRHEYDCLRPVHGLTRSGSLRFPNGYRGLLADSRLENGGLSIAVFGGFSVRVNGHKIDDDEWGRRRARAVLYLLALYPDGVVTREFLIRVLWPGRHDSQARNSLSSVLTSLRATLGQKRGGPQYVVAAGDVLLLDSGIAEVDVRRFEYLCRMILTTPPGHDVPLVLEACTAVDEIYRPGLMAGAEDYPSEVRERVLELDGLFVDCMVRGSETARECDDSELALWFARAAATAASDRADVCRVFDAALESARVGSVSKTVEQQGGKLVLPEPAGAVQPV